MARTQFKLSKVLAKGFGLSFLTILAVTIVSFLAMVLTPNTVYHKILDWMLINHFNPQIYYSEYYQRLSLIANEEDWMIVTPIAYFFGGLVFGLKVAAKRPRGYTLKTAAISSLVFTGVVLSICFFSDDILAVQSSRYGVAMTSVPLTSHALVMIIVQTVYWAAAYTLGAFIATVIRIAKNVQPLTLPKPSATA